MADIASLEAKIRGCEAEINACKDAININNQKIEDLQQLKDRTDLLSSNFAEASSARVNRLVSVTDKWKTEFSISKKIASSYENGMYELLTGNEKENVVAGIATASQRLTEEIQKYESENADLYKRISECQGTIAWCRAEIAALEREEQEQRG